MLAAVVYIISCQCHSTFWKDSSEQSDITKIVNDFIKYANINLTWFSFNLILLGMPPLVIFIIEPLFQELIIEDQGDASLKWMVYILWFLHLVQFSIQNVIYRYTAASKEAIHKISRS
jgi:hypothetical protein